MDFQKACDTVSHKILLKKLYHYGVRGPAYTLIESYLSERNQYASLNDCPSPITAIEIGVSQDSILGPLLYLIYANDICNALSCKPRLFADDTCLIIENSSQSNLELYCNLVLKNLKNWCTANRLEINPQKSAVIVIPPKLNCPSATINLSYNSALITRQNSHKYFGVILDNKLNFKSLIVSLKRSLARYQRL